MVSITIKKKDLIRIKTESGEEVLLKMSPSNKGTQFKISFLAENRTKITREDMNVYICESCGKSFYNLAPVKYCRKTCNANYKGFSEERSMNLELKSYMVKQ